MSKPPRISVVMPVYNSVDTLSRSIESILNQSFTDFEFIIVNEFESNDGSKELIENYAAKDKRIQLLQLDEHAGIAKSLNIGIKHANGEYIARMDSDDYSYPERFAKQIEFMESHGEYILCGTAFNIINEYGKRQFKPFYVTNESLHAYLLFGCVFCHPSVMFRKSLFFLGNMYYNEGIIAEDFDLWTRIDGKMANLPDILFDYYDDGTGATKKSMDLARLTAFDIMKKQLKDRLQIEAEDYPSYIINPDLVASSSVVYETAMMQACDLLLKIEEANCRLHIYDMEALADAESMQWNKYLCVFYARFVTHQSSLPFLENGGGSFSDVLSRKLCVPREQMLSEVGRRTRILWTQASEELDIIVYGAGRYARQYFTEHPDYLKYVICFCDSNLHLDGSSFLGKSVYSPRVLKEKKSTWILISPSSFWEEIVSVLEKMEVDTNRIASLSLLDLIG